MIKVGIPRALTYYQHYPMWRTFFEELGAETVISSQTTRGVLAAGAARVVAETCLPAKVFCGHCLDLGSSVDFIFVPSLKSIEKNVYNCSKFVGLPDLVRQTARDIAPIVDIEIDVNQGMRKVRDEIHRVGQAIHAAPVEDRQGAGPRSHRGQGLPGGDETGPHSPRGARAAVSRISRTPLTGKGRRHCDADPRPLVVALIGHPYNIYDEYVNHNLVGRLRAMNVEAGDAGDDIAGGSEPGDLAPRWQALLHLRAGGDWRRRSLSSRRC